MKKTLNVIVGATIFFTLASCAALLDPIPRNCVKLDYTEEMRVAKDLFPEIYELYRQGQVEIKQIVYDTVTEQYDIQWRYRRTNQ